MIPASATPVSPAASARSLVAAPRPSGSHSTWCPAPARHFPTAAPISPGCSSPIVVRSCLYSHQAPAWAPRQMSRMVAWHGGMFRGVNSFPLMTPIRPSGMTPMSTRPDGLDHSTCVKNYPAGLIFQYPRIRTSSRSWWSTRRSRTGRSRPADIAVPHGSCSRTRASISTKSGWTGSPTSGSGFST